MNSKSPRAFAPLVLPGAGYLRHLCLFAGLAAGVEVLVAQTVAPPAAGAPRSPEDTVVLEQFTVTSLRGSLISAQELKQNAPEFVDSIVAQDIGKLPDNTVAEAVSRVPGVQVSHGGGEASNVVIRGLPNIETTLNGYEVFTGTGRGVALQDIPAEMLAGVDVYKSVGPDKVEGGVAGLIDVRLRRPFDFKPGLTFAANARGFYSDQAKEYSYVAGLLASDRWKTSEGEFGLLVDVSRSHQKYEDQIVDNYVHFGANGETFDLATDPSGVRGYYADNYGMQLVPGNRIRPAASVMLQWRTNSGIQFYWDNLFTGYRNDHTVDFFIGIPSFGGFRDNVVLFPAGAGGYNVPEKYDALGTPARFVQSLVAHNTNTITSKQSFSDKTDTYQGAIGGKWDVNQVRLSGEVSYNFTTVHTRAVILDTIIVTPNLAITYVPGEPSMVNLTGIDYTDPSNFHMSQYFDQWGRDHSVAYAARSDATIRLENPLLSAVQFGLRYSDRDVNSHSANPGSYPLPFATLASTIPGLGRLSNSTPFVSPSQLNVRKWWSADEKFLLSNTDTIRALGNRPLGLPPADPSRVFLDKEKTFAVYGMGDYRTHLGDLPLDGEVGARFTDAHQSLGGYQRQTVNGSTTGAYILTTDDKSRWDVLPVVTSRLKLRDDLQVRASFTKTVTRPNFSSLNPATSLTSPGPTIQGSGSGGNPDLNPIRSTNYDLSLEYYPTKTTQATIAGFYRTIDGYIQNYASQEVIGGNSYSVTRPRSTHNGYLQGIETGYQQFLDFVPEPFKGIGFQVNYTYIKGETESPLTLQKTPLAQVSKNNYNAVLIYEKGAVSARLAYNWRDKFIDSFNQPGIQPTTVWVQSNDRLDFSGSYAVTKDLTITIDATNLLRHKYKDNFGDIPLFQRDVRNYDRTYGIGIRYRY